MLHLPLCAHFAGYVTFEVLFCEPYDTQTLLFLESEVSFQRPIHNYSRFYYLLLPYQGYTYQMTLSLFSQKFPNQSPTLCRVSTYFSSII